MIIQRSPWGINNGPVEDFPEKFNPALLPRFGGLPDAVLPALGQHVPVPLGYEQTTSLRLVLIVEQC